MMAFAWRTLWGLCAFVGLLLPTGGFCESCEAYKDSDGRLHSQNGCLQFCCGTCTSRYCCSDAFERIDQFQCSWQKLRREISDHMEEAMKLESDFSDLYSSGPSGATIIAIGVSIFIVSIVTFILCFTCSCCCLYKACRRPPQPVTTTTVVQVPYPQQQPGIPATYPGVYQGYSPLPVQPHPGMPTAPYPTQYPPPYPTQPAGPPAYHETMAAGPGVPVAQPPYNPAYMDPPRS